MRKLVAIALMFLAFQAVAANPQVEMKTSAGTIVLELYPEKAPKTVANFLEYTKSGFYKGTIFHRVIQNFMIQGGGYDAKLQEKATHSPIKNESDNGLANEAFTIAMARTSDPDSATAQFFINLKNNGFLNYSPRGHGYAVFGRVIKGEEIVSAIGKTPTGARGFLPSDVPRKDIVIEDVRILGDAAK